MRSGPRARPAQRSGGQPVQVPGERPDLADVLRRRPAGSPSAPARSRPLRAAASRAGTPPGSRRTAPHSARSRRAPSGSRSCGAAAGRPWSAPGPEEQVEQLAAVLLPRTPAQLALVRRPPNSATCRTASCGPASPSRSTASTSRWSRTSDRRPPGRAFPGVRARRGQVAAPGRRLRCPRRWVRSVESAGAPGPVRSSMAESAPGEPTILLRIGTRFVLPGYLSDGGPSAAGESAESSQGGSVPSGSQ